MATRIDVSDDLPNVGKSEGMGHRTVCDMTPGVVGADVAVGDGGSAGVLGLGE